MMYPAIDRMHYPAEITLIERRIIDVANINDPPACNDAATISRELEPTG